MWHMKVIKRTYMPFTLILGLVSVSPLVWMQDSTWCQNVILKKTHTSVTSLFNMDIKYWKQHPQLHQDFVLVIIAKSSSTFNRSLNLSCASHAAVWWLSGGPVGGVLGASSSVPASTFCPPSLSHPPSGRSLSFLSVSPSSPLPHFFLLSSQCIKCIILSHLALPSRTAPRWHSARAHTQMHLHAHAASPRKWDKELATPKGPASVTLLPRLDHMASGAESSERMERGGVGTRVGGEKKSAQEEGRKKRKCDKDTEDEEMKAEERQMGPERGREKGRGRQIKKRKKK